MVETKTAAALAEVISERIDAAGLSEAEVCRRTGIAAMTLNRKRKGFVPFNAAEVAQIARALGTSGSELWADAESREVA